VPVFLISDKKYWTKSLLVRGKAVHEKSSFMLFKALFLEKSKHGRGSSLSLPLLSHGLVLPREEMHVIPWDSITYGMLDKQPGTGLGAKLGHLPLSRLTSKDLSFQSSF